MIYNVGVDGSIADYSIFKIKLIAPREGKRIWGGGTKKKNKKEKSGVAKELSPPKILKIP
jgi:hypothetical protein